MMKYLFCIIFLLPLFLQGQDISKVSMIGEDDDYEQLMSRCSTMLLQVTDNSMDEAFSLWTDMLSAMEKSADNQGIDFKGMKVWVNLFWAADGSIDKIVYYPKPNSKNMDFNEVSEVLEIFANEYVIPITHTDCFSHYGSASFPVYSKLSNVDEK